MATVTWTSRCSMSLDDCKHFNCKPLLVISCLCLKLGRKKWNFHRWRSRLQLGSIRWSLSQLSFVSCWRKGSEGLKKVSRCPNVEITQPFSSLDVHKVCYLEVVLFGVQVPVEFTGLPVGLKSTDLSLGLSTEDHTRTPVVID